MSLRPEMTSMSVPLAVSAPRHGTVRGGQDISAISPISPAADGAASFTGGGTPIESTPVGASSSAFTPVITRNRRARSSVGEEGGKGSPRIPRPLSICDVHLIMEQEQEAISYAKHKSQVNRALRSHLTTPTSSPSGSLMPELVDPIHRTQLLTQPAHPLSPHGPPQPPPVYHHHPPNYGVNGKPRSRHRSVSSLSNISTSGLGTGGASLPSLSPSTANATEGGASSIPRTIADSGKFSAPSRDRDGLFFDSDSKTTKAGNIHHRFSERPSLNFDRVPVSGGKQDTKGSSGVDGRHQNQYQLVQQRCHCSILSHALSVSETETLKQENNKLERRVRELEEQLKAKENTTEEKAMKPETR